MRAHLLNSPNPEGSLLSVIIIDFIAEFEKKDSTWAESVLQPLKLILSNTVIDFNIDGLPYMFSISTNFNSFNIFIYEDNRLVII